MRTASFRRARPCTPWDRRLKSHARERAEAAAPACSASLEPCVCTVVTTPQQLPLKCPPPGPGPYQAVGCLSLTAPSLALLYRIAGLRPVPAASMSPADALAPAWSESTGAESCTPEARRPCLLPAGSSSARTGPGGSLNAQCPAFRVSQLFTRRLPNTELAPGPRLCKQKA